jgi:ferrochelatase
MRLVGHTQTLGGLGWQQREGVGSPCISFRARAVGASVGQRAVRSGRVDGRTFDAQRRAQKKIRAFVENDSMDVMDAVGSQASFVDLEMGRGAEEAETGPGHQSVGKLGVLLLNLGGPETLDDVQPFLYNLFADPDIIRLPPAVQFLQPVIANFIATSRAPKSREGYESIGGGSPLRKITDDQAQALEASLTAKGFAAKAYVAMRYWKPFTEEAIAHIKEDGITSLVVLPLYPQFSVSTSGSSLRLLERILKEDAALSSNVRHVVIPSWYQRPGYVNAMADLIEGELMNEGVFKEKDRGGVELFFSAHGVPQSYVDEGDPYKMEMEECVQLIMQELRDRRVNNSYTLAYQSRVGPVPWLKPYTDDSIRYLGEQRGVKSLLAIPISFVSEHIETLEEIDMEYRELAIESGIKNWGRVPALNTNAKFIDDLADAVVEALPYMGSVSVGGPGPTGGSAMDSIVPIGEVNALLDTYDKERKVLPSPVFWEPGWTRNAEMWNGRIAMVAIIAILATEALTGKGVMQNLFPDLQGLLTK